MSETHGEPSVRRERCCDRSHRCSSMFSESQRPVTAAPGNRRSPSLSPEHR
ncbi:hypothetical protein L083_1315 [Actinoplanes sp. N902-109]|nr:hypothetical protein L083_1315 [Actinoplanes sp. N902-109]